MLGLYVFAFGCLNFGGYFCLFMLVGAKILMSSVGFCCVFGVFVTAFLTGFVCLGLLDGCLPALLCFVALVAALHLFLIYINMFFGF